MMVCNLRENQQVEHVLVALLFLATLGWVSPASAQSRDTASVYGTVNDPQGAVIPAAAVTLTNVATGQTRTVGTGAEGTYVFTLVSVGSYTIEVENPGFQRFVRTGILLQTNENVRVDIELAVGAVTETVIVNALGSQVETRSATIKETVDARRVIELPLNGRNPADLVLLSPGVAAASGNTGERESRWRAPGQRAFTVNGSRNNNLRYTLDGGENMDTLVNLNMPFPFPDAVQEFSAQTSNMGVELGGSSGGVVNVTTKSGTNQFHGNGFWFVRNTTLNANDFFSRQEDQLKRNQFGGTVGGPVVKNKLFFFAGYQKLLIRRGSADSRDQTLTAAERRGDFSSNSIPLFIPGTADRFTNNTIPASQLSPAAQNLLALSPLPDPDGFTRFQITQPEDQQQYIVRVDYIQNDKSNFQFRVFRSDRTTPFSSDPTNIHAARAAGTSDSTNATLGHNYIFSPNLLAHSQFTASHHVADTATDFPFTTADFGIDLTPNGNHTDITLENSGVNFSAPLHAIKFARTNFEWTQDWTWTRDKHNFVWGFQINRKRFNNNTQFHSSGFFRFDGHATGGPNAAGFDRADFVLGRYSFFSQNSGEFEGRRGTQAGYYFGDTWRITPNFTLTLGVRYEPYRIFEDTEDRAQTFDLGNYQNGIQSEIFTNAPAGLLYRGDITPPGFGGGSRIGKTVMRGDYNNLAPRFGFAWDPFGDGKTSIRGGYAIFYDTPSLNALNDSNNVTPFSFAVDFDDGLLDTPFLGRENLNLFPVIGFPSDIPFPAPVATIIVDNKLVTTDSQNWSLTVEREVLRDTRLRVGYVGTKGTHLKTEWDQNAPIYNTNLTLAENRATIVARRPIVGFQRISRWMNAMNSTYHSLQVSLNKRYSDGFTVSTAYTWSKTLDFVSQNGFGGGNSPQNPFDFFMNRGLSDRHRKHRFTTSFVWDLPSLDKTSTPAAVKAVFGGWRYSGILTLQSGRPFNIFSAGDPVAGAGRAFADISGSGDAVLDTGRSKGAKIEEYFDISRFSSAGPNQRGSLGRNVLIGPGYGNFDMSLVRGFPIRPLGEAGKAEFRFEAFNLLNATHLANPRTGITNSNFGKITGTDGGPRILQLALKILF